MDDKYVVHIWGAGVDKSIGLPLADELWTRIAEFAGGKGKPVDIALRSHLPHLRFSFEKYSGDKGEAFAESMLKSDTQLLTGLKSIMETHITNIESEDNMNRVWAVKEIIDSLEIIRKKNIIEDDTLADLSYISGSTHESSGGDYILSPRGISMTPIVRQAFKDIFRGISSSRNISEEEQKILHRISRLVMNMEELLAEFFGGFYTSHKADQKRYIYISWLLWAYFRLETENKKDIAREGIYGYLADLHNHKVITLNYTSDFFPDDVKSSVYHFHGDCFSYIRMDTRDLITRDEQLFVESPDDIASLIKGLKFNLNKNQIYLPGIIPPLFAKPVICKEYLEAWYECGQIIDKAKAIIIIGYSFNQADEHLNDLLRKRRGNNETPIIVINPDLEGILESACQILRTDINNLNDTQRAGFECKETANLLFVSTKTEELDLDIINILLEDME